MYDAYIGPIHKAIVVAAFQITTTQTRARVSKRSSTLPAMTTDGTADAIPVRKRPIKIAAGVDVLPRGIIAQKTLKTADEMRYGYLRPASSDRGGMR